MATTTGARRAATREPDTTGRAPATRIETEPETGAASPDTGAAPTGFPAALLRGVRAVIDTMGAPVSDSLLGRHPRPAPITLDERVEDGAVVVEAELPGVGPDAITVAAEDGRLTLQADREPEPASGVLRRHERRTGRFARDLALPPHTDPTTITATYADGVLTVRVPLPAPPAPVDRVEIPVRHHR
ncbi:Hsp20/alpha crystallin family protein [Actinomycetospora rhizophila]|uniref:Hsp20/alpha crystallin family protein n=1 Tax=Actinomycetospora rhizophila TaxID=1416876 RepID=A0ABV9ZH48_9PSEU